MIHEDSVSVSSDSSECWEVVPECGHSVIPLGAGKSPAILFFVSKSANQPLRRPNNISKASLAEDMEKHAVRTDHQPHLANAELDDFYLPVLQQPISFIIAKNKSQGAATDKTTAGTEARKVESSNSTGACKKRYNISNSTSDGLECAAENPNWRIRDGVDWGPMSTPKACDVNNWRVREPDTWGTTEFPDKYCNGAAQRMMLAPTVQKNFKTGSEERENCFRSWPAFNGNVGGDFNRAPNYYEDANDKCSKEDLLFRNCQLPTPSSFSMEWSSNKTQKATPSFASFPAQGVQLSPTFLSESISPVQTSVHNDLLLQGNKLNSPTSETNTFVVTALVHTECTLDKYDKNSNLIENTQDSCFDEILSFTTSSISPNHEKALMSNGSNGSTSSIENGKNEKAAGKSFYDVNHGKSYQSIINMIYKKTGGIPDRKSESDLYLVKRDDTIFPCVKDELRPSSVSSERCLSSPARPYYRTSSVSFDYNEYSPNDCVIPVDQSSDANRQFNSIIDSRQKAQDRFKQLKQNWNSRGTD